MRGTTRRAHPKDSFIPPPPPPDYHHRQQQQFTSRDSDVSLASSRPSSIGARASTAVDYYTNRSNQNSATQLINSYLSSHSFTPLLPYPVNKQNLPSAKDITDIIKFIVSQLDYPVTKLEDDLFLVLKFLNCPFKVNKSSLRSPNTPHNWPYYLACIHWLVQIASYTHHLNDNARSFVQNDSMYTYALDSYLNYIHGDDDSVEALDREFIEKVEKERDSVKESVGELERSFKELEAKAEGLRTGPTQRELLENERKVLEEDVNKFNLMIQGFNTKNAEMEEAIEEKLRAKAVKEEETRKLSKENEELRKRVEVQKVNSRDAERMKRELQIVERDIEAMDRARTDWEDKVWELDSSIAQKYNELEALTMEANQAIKRLKLDNSFQYVLNSKGSTPSEVMGIDYKSKLQPALEAFSENVNKNSMAMLDESAPLRKQETDIAARIEAKKTRIAKLQSHIEEVEAQLQSLKKEIQDYTLRCAAEVKKMEEDVQNEAQNLEIVEKQASEVLKAAELKFHEVNQQSEEEIQKRACELFSIVDSVSKYKEFMESKISEMKSDLSETANALSDAYKGFLPTQYGITSHASP
ncbi:hypothetical protein ACFE04_022962 [Oxalis oulophora]